MPPTTETQVVGWLLLVIPGFVAVTIASYLGSPATRRSDLRWVAYSVLASVALEVFVRWTLDRWLPGLLDSQLHPVRRAGTLVLVGAVAGGSVALIQNQGFVSSLRWRIFEEAAEPRVWSAFFRHPDAQRFVRVELTGGQGLIGHIHLFSTDAGDPPRELVLTDVHVECEGEMDASPRRSLC